MTILKPFNYLIIRQCHVGHFVDDHIPSPKGIAVLFNYAWRTSGLVRSIYLMTQEEIKIEIANS